MYYAATILIYATYKFEFVQTVKKIKKKLYSVKLTRYYNPEEYYTEFSRVYPMSAKFYCLITANSFQATSLPKRISLEVRIGGGEKTLESTDPISQAGITAHYAH